MSQYAWLEELCKLLRAELAGRYNCHKHGRSIIIERHNGTAMAHLFADESGNIYVHTKSDAAEIALADPQCLTKVTQFVNSLN